SPSPERNAALDKAVMALAAKPLDAESADAFAVAIFTFVQTQEQPTHEQIVRLSGLVAALKPRLRHAELLTLGLIAGLPQERAERGRTIPALLECAALAEEAAACDGRCLPWIKETLGAADTRRREAVRKICDPSSKNTVRDAAVAEL